MIYVKLKLFINKIMKNKIGIIFLLLISIILCIFILFPKVCSGYIPTQYKELYNLTNEARVKNGVNKLRYNYRLQKSATMKACDMRDRNYWSHQDPEGRYSWYMISKVGYRYRMAGENLAKDFNSNEGMLEALMNSKTHRANILNPQYQDIGIGKCGTFTVFHFGKLQI